MKEKKDEFFIKVLVDEIRQRSDSEIDEFLKKDFTDKEFNATYIFLNQE